jgi:S-DNA-T family DNA segregation ATPase FtsK/SpoIIIE
MADVQAYEPGPPEPDEPAAEVTSDSHMDAPLDDEDEYRQQQARKPVFVDATVREHEVRPIIPANLRTWENIKKTAEYWAKLTGRRAAVHAVRVPFLYLPKALFWAPIGAFRLVGRQLVTAGIRQSWHLQQVAATARTPRSGASCATTSGPT